VVDDQIRSGIFIKYSVARISCRREGAGIAPVSQIANNRYYPKIYGLNGAPEIE
jgi:hypothetical protein